MVPVSGVVPSAHDEWDRSARYDDRLGLSEFQAGDVKRPVDVDEDALGRHVSYFHVDAGRVLPQPRVVAIYGAAAVEEQDAVADPSAANLQATESDLRRDANADLAFVVVEASVRRVCPESAIASSKIEPSSGVVCAESVARLESSAPESDFGDGGSRPVLKPNGREGSICAAEGDGAPISSQWVSEHPHGEIAGFQLVGGTRIEWRRWLTAGGISGWWRPSGARLREDAAVYPDTGEDENEDDRQPEMWVVAQLSLHSLHYIKLGCKMKKGRAIASQCNALFELVRPAIGL